MRYFAYGSNMSLERISKRLGFVKKLKIAKLENFELVFNCGTDTQSFANIQEKNGSYVEGVIYDLTEEQLMLLDYYEGVGWKKYYDKIVEIIDDNPVYIYINHNTRDNIPVSQDYYKTLLV